MKSNDQNPLYALLQKKYAILIVLGLLACIFTTAYYICTVSLDTKKAEILEEESQVLTTWVQGTTQAMELWVQSVDEQGQRVSTSDLYRVFLEDVRLAGQEVAGKINTLDSAAPTSALDDNYVYFIEQVPHMRSVLYDFMVYNGMSDARLVSENGTTILSGLQIPTPVTEAQKKCIAQAIATNTITFAPIRGTAAAMVIDYALPIPPLFAETSDKPIAAVMLTQPVTNQIAQFLSREMRADSTLVPNILQKSNDKFELIKISSPQPTTIQNSLDFDTNNVLPFAKRQAVGSSTEVYSYGEKVKGIDLYVVLELPTEILDQTFTSLAWTTYGLGALGSIGITLLCALLWWVVIGTEQKAVANRFKNLYDVIAQQKGLLDSINLSLEVGLILVDSHGVIKISNKTFNEIVEQDHEQMKDANLMSVFDPQLAGDFMQKVTEVVESGDPANFEIAVQKTDEQLLFRVTMYPFRDNPLDDIDNGNVVGAVATLQDITAFRRNSEKNRKKQENIVHAFVRAIEGVDPYLTGHSQMMSNIGVLMAKHIEMANEDIQTVHDASIFSQIGKLFINREILTKTGKLEPEELAAIRNLPVKAYEVLSGIGFSDPIATAVLEMYENIDGTGYPKGIQGEEIIVQARILAITNAFCAMISERAFRKGLPIPDAIARLKGDTNKFDQKLVDVLTEVIDSPEGMQALIVEKDNLTFEKTN